MMSVVLPLASRRHVSPHCKASAGERKSNCAALRKLATIRSPGSGRMTRMDDKLIGIVERVTFHNPENGFAVLRVQATGRRGLVTVVGMLPSIVAGEQIEAIGSWVQDREHG